MISGIYAIINILNNKLYIGNSKNVHYRWIIHQRNLNGGYHINKYLQAAWNKYSKINFKFEILEIVNDRSKLIEREQYWLDKFKSYNRVTGYNINIIANSRIGTKLGRKLTFTKEHRQRLSISQKGKIISDDQRIAISIANKNRTGIKYNKIDRKWNCPNGQKCKCNNCMKRKREFVRLSREKRKAALAQLEVAPHL